MMHAWIHFGCWDAQLPLSREQRRDVQKRAYLYARSNRRFLAKLAAACLALPVAVAVVGYVLAVSLMGLVGERIAAPIGVLSACAVCVLLFARLVSAWKRRFIRMAVRDLGYDICLHCGYWQRDLGHDIKRCPECGAAREPMPGEIKS